MRASVPASLFLASLLAISAAQLTAQRRAAPAGDPLPDGPQKATVLKLCGTCHNASIVAGQGRTPEQWGEVIASMIGRGAKGAEAEFAQVTDYLTKNFPPQPNAPAAPARRGGGGGFSMGPADKQIVDATAAARGKTIYVTDCVTCHGPLARGPSGPLPENQKGSDLVRSIVVLHDRYGSTLGPFLKKGHPMQSGAPSSGLTGAQVADLSHFLHQRVNDTLRGGAYSQILNVVTGDAKAGEAYFNGPGKCNTCHSPTGDLAGVATKYNPPTLQTKFLFPETSAFGRGRGAAPATTKPVMLTVTPPGGPPVTGKLEKIDDFNVSLRDSAGDYHAWKRTPDLKVEKNDPYAVHHALLDEYTDKNMHDVVAYLETLK
jgi:cytochrome c oxidase cbb3-type subunit III